MQIEFTKEQFRNLIMMADTASNVLGLLGDHIEDKKYKKMSDKVEGVRSYILSRAEDFGCGDLIEKWEGKIILNDKTGDKFQEIMDDFEDWVIFDGLANKLAWRDFYRDHSEAELKEIHRKYPSGYFAVELYDYEKKYWDEFEKHDYNRLEIKENNKKSEK